MAIPDRPRIKDALVKFIAEKGGERLSVTTRQAYLGLAEKLQLTQADLERERESDNHWQNEVRWARQDLVAEGILLPVSESGHGRWQLKPDWELGRHIAQTVPNEKRKTELEVIGEDLKDEGVFDPANLMDARDIILRGIVQRRGQEAFRTKLMKAYAKACAVSHESCTSVLEAAHIIPYWGEKTNHVQNGLLLRSDIHTLFDLHLLTVDSTFLIHVSPSLKSTKYFQLEGRTLKTPTELACFPSAAALEQHQSECDF